jgi:transposase
MIPMQLSPEEHAFLEYTRWTSRSQVAERYHYVLLNAVGWSVPQVAQRLKRNERTIRKWITAYQAQGVMVLRNLSPPERPPLKGEDLGHQLEMMLS